MKTQHEQIQEATAAYIMPLSESSKTSGTARYAVYLSGADGKLEILWPDNCHENKKAKLLPDQVYYSPKDGSWGKYPAFHFRLSGWGYSKADEIRRTLRQINPDLQVFVINGWSPSASM